ncbi:hypothetical protein POTOM_024611 [Populus tomentosa]|uniref:S-adenosyl-L-methionine-dependent methyltransferases superfamily protein n=1 Tax=Populus tomentosa TaxID=118781 RepID=A0A8X8CMZ5_POPTO|nr:hypothetical protein POTOM_024611 [Populus tomentosa]
MMKPPQGEEEDEEQLRQRKLEEALEVKSLRRIISAYLNYPEAAEEDVKRYERSFRKLSSSHKALLSHYPLKFQSLRRCISINSFFIINMLQAFEPPLDMSHDVDDCGCSHFEQPPNDRNVCSHESAAASGSCCSKPDEACCGEPSNMMSKPADCLAPNEEVDTEGCLGSDTGSCLADRENYKMTSECCRNHVSDSNENVLSSHHDWLDPSLQLRVPMVDVDKVRCIIRNIVRDWAAEGQKERDQCYKPILEELNSLFPDRSNESPPTCLVPGAGLGRLALEISCLGFVSQGNEFSYYMMICSSFILNQTETAGEWTIYPWIHSNCNSLSDGDQLRPVSLPDIHPASFKSTLSFITSSAGITEGFSMCGGDFVEVYSDPSQVGVWDAVVTCFFIDTAHNIVEYIEIISRILKDGGVWINLGPLLYHFADVYGQEDEMSIELSLEDVKRVALNYGFEVEKESTIETTYTTNPRAMMQNRYFAAFWTMRKKSVEKHST